MQKAENLLSQTLTLKILHRYGYLTKNGLKTKLHPTNRVQFFIILAYLSSQISLIAVLSSPSITTLANAGIQIISIPKGARYPLAMAIAFIA